MVLMCLIPMIDLISSPYNLAFDSLVQAKVIAQNSLGYALEYSPANTIGARIR